MAWRILIVDDEAASRGLVAEILSGNPHYRIEDAQDGDEALRMLREAQAQDPFDLVLTDLSMPRLNGVRLAEEVAHEFPRTAIAVMTGVGDKDSLVRLMRSGVCEYIEKPFSPPEITDLVERMIVGGSRPGVMGELRRLHEEIEDLVDAEVAKKEAEVIRWIRGGMRHRFNQPLTVLSANISLLRRILNEETIREDLCPIAESVLAEMNSSMHCIRDLIGMLSSLKSIESAPYVGRDRILDFEASAELPNLA